MKLLIIEDEKELSDNIVAYLSSEDYVCEQAFTYNDATMKVNIYDYDCVLLDLMLRVETGWTSCATSVPSGIRGCDYRLAKDAIDDKVKDWKLAQTTILPNLSIWRNIRCGSMPLSAAGICG